MPRTYVHTTQDRCVSIASRRELVATVGGTATAELDAGHLVMLSRPDELVAVLDPTN